MSFELVQVDLRNLEGGEPCVLTGTLLPTNLDLDHKEAEQFSAVEYNLEIQLFGESLLIKATLKGEKTIPCKICNKEFTTPILLERVDEVILLDEIEGHKVDLTPTIRNLFLLEAPEIVECNMGSCTDREEVENFLKRKRLSPCPFDSLS
ncbi:MAG: YceD family protein [Chlamydiia bacterium]